MTCIRCEGLMLEEHMIDMEGGNGEMWSVSTRCVNCGHRDDAVIQHYRQLSAKPVMATMSAREVFNLDWNSEELKSLAA